jgi:hypothetical protein
MASEKMFRKKEDDRFPGGIPWYDISSQKIYMLHDKLIYDTVESKGEIEVFAESSKAKLKPYGKITMIGGDFDWYGNNKTLPTEEVREINRKAVERCGPGSLRALFPYSRVNKLAKTYQNAKGIQSLGIQVKIRDWDEAVRAIVVEQRNDKNELDYASGCFWWRPAVDENFVIKDGFPQEETEELRDMNTHGWRMEMLGNELKENAKAKVLIPAINYANNMWNSPRLKTIDQIILDQQVAEEVKRIEKLQNGNHKILQNIE